MEHPDDVVSPFRWLDGDSLWNDLLSIMFAGSAWPEGSETAIWDLAQEWVDLADGLASASGGLQAAAADLLTAWDAPAAECFDDLARQMLGSPDVGLPGHLQNATAIAQQLNGFGVDLQYAKISINVAVVVAAMAVVLMVITAIAGGVSLLSLGPIASTAREALLAALEGLASAAGRKALVQGVGRAVTEQTGALVGRAAARTTGHHLAHEVVEEVLEELVIDVTSQAWQMSEGTRTDWNGLSTVQAALGGGFGGATGAGLVGPVFARLRRSPRVTAIAGLGADGSRLARTGNYGIRHTGGLVATAGTNAVASPVGGIAASMLTGQGFPALDGSIFGMAALGAVGRYGTVSPTNPAVLSAAVHPVQTLSQVHLDALAGHRGQKELEAARSAAAGWGTITGTSTAPGTTHHGTTAPPRGSVGAAPSTTASAPMTARTVVAPAVGGSPATALPAPGTTTGGPSAPPATAHPAAALASPAAIAPPSSATAPASTGPIARPAATPVASGPSTSSTSSSGQTQGSSTERTAAPGADRTLGTADPTPVVSGPVDAAAAAPEASTPNPTEPAGPVATRTGSTSTSAGQPPGSQQGSSTDSATPSSAAQVTTDPASGIESEPRLGAGRSDAVTGDAASASDHLPPAPPPPPTSERELYEGMPAPLRRYLMEAVAHGQVWADLVQHQLAEVYGWLQAEGLPAPEAVGLVNAVKSLESAARKIQPPIQGGSTFASAIWSMDDLVRFSLQIDPEHYGESVLRALEAFRALGWAVPAVPGPGETHDDWRNTWAVGNRHHGLLVVMTHAETGQRVEMQFPTPQSWAVGTRTHKLYEFLRIKSNDNVERVVALARIRDLVRAENVEGRAMQGIDKLGPTKKNGAVEVFAKEPGLAADFLTRTVDEAGSAAAALMARGISRQTAEEIVVAALKFTNDDTSRAEDGLHNDESGTPGLGDLGPSAPPPPGELGELGSGDGRSGPSRPSGVPAPPGGSGSGAPGPPRSAPGGGTREGEGLHLPNRDLAKARDKASPGEPLGGRRGPGVDPVRRPGPSMDLGPTERERDRAPGGRGPVRLAGAGDPGGSRGPGSPEGDDAADPGTPAGDVPDPGGSGAGHVGDLGGQGEAAQPAALTGPWAVGADAATALQHVLDQTQPPLLWDGADGVLPGRVLMLADGSAVRINTGPNPWARTDLERPLQMWTVGAFHLDDGPLTPAASAFLGDLRTALEEPGAGLPGPSSHWLAQRATLDPGTHTIEEPGVARPRAEGGPVLVWDAAQGWVDATQAGDLARAIDDGLVPAAAFATWVDEPAAGLVVEGAAELVQQLQQTEQAEAVTTTPGTPGHRTSIESRALRRADLRAEGARWVTRSLAPALAQFLGQRVQPLRVLDGRALVELDHGRLAVVSLAYAENDVLAGSRPGLQQAGTTTDIGQLRNQLASYPENEAVVASLTQELREGAVRHFRLQGVLADEEFVGMRVTEFEVVRPADDEVGVQRSGVEPHRHIAPGLSTSEGMTRAVAGWRPTSVTDAIRNASRWLPFINPLHDRYPRTARMPYSTNCADCTRATADLVQGRGARAAFGDNGARVLDDHRIWGTDPGELNEMWRYAGVVGSWHTGQGRQPGDFRAQSDQRIGEALARRPEGTVAMVLVNWADDQGRTTGGHWFAAAVTEDGVEWLDGQSAQHHAWPPPYTTPYSGYAVITRAQDSDTWVDLFAGPTTTAPSPPIGGAATGPIGRGPRSLDAADATLAARLSNPSGAWPDDDEDQDQDDDDTGRGVRNAAGSATVTVESPLGERRSISVAWFDRSPGPAPVLLLREIPGQRFWWSAPEAVLDAVDRARVALDPDPARWASAVVLGCTPASGHGSGVTQYPVDLTRGSASRSTGVPRELSADEADRALAYVGMHVEHGSLIVGNVRGSSRCGQARWCGPPRHRTPAPNTPGTASCM